MTRPGRKRKHNPHIPTHIDQDALPAGVYWDASGNGRWYMFEDREGRPARKTIAGPNARLSDLHQIAEDSRDAEGPTRGTVAWVLKAFHDSTRFAGFSISTKRDYEFCRTATIEFPTRAGPFGNLVASKITQTHVFRMLETVAKMTPSKANHMLRYLRRAFKWAGPGVGMKHNPAWGLEEFRERKRRRLPPPEVYADVLAYAHRCGALKAHTKGSQPPYLWMALELAYLCRLRGIEVDTLVESQATAEGIRTDRRKGSRNNIVAWSPRLRAAWDAAIAHRRGVIKRRKQPDQIHADRRFLFLSEDGEPLSKSGLDSAWQRMMLRAIEDGIITADQRFGLHDLKRKGVTDTAGTKADRQDAAGLTEAMMTVYDFSVPVVKPADAP
ncbi:MAG: integrase [Rhodanobacter sp.]